MQWYFIVMLLMIATMQLRLQNIYDTPLESFFNGESEYKGVELYTLERET